MTETVPRNCGKQEIIVVLGNDEKYVAWIVTCLSKNGHLIEDLLTVYNPKCIKDIDSEEQNLELYLQVPRGCLVTKRSLFEGMESATVVLVYSNPYSSHFRRTYLRASVELVLIDRNSLGTAQINPIQHLKKQQTLKQENFFIRQQLYGFSSIDHLIQQEKWLANNESPSLYDHA